MSDEIKRTLDESRDHKIELLRSFCDSNNWCDACLLRGTHCNETIDFTNLPNSALNEMLDIIFPPTTVEEEPPVEHNAIQHPNHYCRDGAMECIDEMVLLFGKEVVKHFCLCNVWKYRYRSNSKNGEEDIKKSDEYMRIYKRLCEG